MSTATLPIDNLTALPKLSPEKLKTAIAAGIASGKGKSANEVFNRLEIKYRKQAGN